MGFKKNKKELLKCIKDDKISIGNSNKNSMIIVNVLNSETELYDNQSNPFLQYFHFQEICLFQLCFQILTD